VIKEGRKETSKGDKGREMEEGRRIIKKGRKDKKERKEGRKKG
jgi:hypothetical protein